MIKTVLTAGIAMLALATAAVAADLPSKVEEPEFAPSPQIPVFTWTGLYGGFQAGYGVGRDSGALRRPAAGPQSFGYDPNGVVGGAHLGYNLEVPSVKGTHLVVGAEGDINGADYQRTRSPFGGVLAGTTVMTDSSLKGSVRGRLGLGVNRVLVYATGGAAFANFNTRYNSVPTFGAGAFDSIERTRTGYTLGGGVEYAFLNYLSVRAEYRYSDYGTFTDQLNASAPGLNATVTHRETDSRLQAGLSYKFESILPSPVP